MKNTLYFLSTSYNISNKRIIKKTGIIFIEIKEITKNNIESIDIKQSILGKILNYGDLIIKGSGGSEVVMSYVVNPTQFKDNLYNGLDAQGI
jgi:uncharacterized membrane protein YdbT with pleckstrin-like domain